MMDYKKTLNLPKTSFSMRANLTHIEPKILNNWYKKNLYNIIRQVKKGKKTFILHDGPPYANGKLHIGHAVNKILKDIIIKSKGLSGFDAPYIPGWDCHGLPIEHIIEKKIKNENMIISNNHFRKLCRKYVNEQIDCQKKDFIRMGILADWNNFYSTMDFKIEANITRSLIKIIKSKYLIKGVKPVHWCIECSSSLAEAELEYKNKLSDSVYVKFNVINSQLVYELFNIKNLLLPISAIIWTTNPWTLPGNVAIAVHKNFRYQLIKINRECFIISEFLIRKIIKCCLIKKWTLLSTIEGYRLKSLFFIQPFNKTKIPVIFDKNITSKIGTGLVHIASGHGPEDYALSKKYRLKVINLIDNNGYYFSNIHPLLNNTLLFDEANNKVISFLKEKDLLFHQLKYEHSYPYCWRHKIPIIFRITPQWFIDLDKNNLRSIILKNLSNIKWIPSWGEKRMKSMLLDRPDWCISRQRIWGTPIALFIHKKTKKLHPCTLNFLEVIAKKIEKNGIQSWWNLNPEILLGNESSNYDKLDDILDVWFDSGSMHYTVMRDKLANKEPIADLYLEGEDQYRGWFMSSLILSNIFQNKAPYKAILSHCFTVDDRGYKMSKSLGNIITPQDIINEWGADILRLWVAVTDYKNEMKISKKILYRIVDIYRKIRNTARFILGNLYEFDPKIHKIDKSNMVILDQWIVHRCFQTQESIKKYYENYNFRSVIKKIMDFCSNDMGSFYLDIIKDRQYTIKKNSISRYSAQTAMYHILHALVRWIAPVLSFTSDEIWKNIPGVDDKEIFAEEYYQDLFLIDSNELFNDTFWNGIFMVRDSINKVLEKGRINGIISNSLEAEIILYVNTNLSKILHHLENELHFLLLISKIKIIDIGEFDKKNKSVFKIKKIKFFKANGTKCLRCWHISETVGLNLMYPDLCNRCILNVFGNGEIRKFV
ncbi:MAG: isoleucine--tRNA ligase [Arsenophonus sp.]|nr:MAG: isoleucine--tRNA ligase [Arsenophonus sp.]